MQASDRIMLKKVNDQFSTDWRVYQPNTFELWGNIVFDRLLTHHNTRYNTHNSQ